MSAPGRSESRSILSPGVAEAEVVPGRWPAMRFDQGHAGGVAQPFPSASRGALRRGPKRYTETRGRMCASCWVEHGCREVRATK